MIKKLLRCAIYTRKSTEHNLDLEFNSLDAQREACEAYIKSQSQEGWQLIPTAFDDGGISGASLNRPALQLLLEDIRAGRVDTVVVYKVDRLTRSLADFAKLVDVFDAHNVSFVSITQAFNTTSSMGRLTLNVLLSFAQFEREVIGERVRDKISASKRKGLWVGGPVPLGYINKDKKLVIVPDEAETVRAIFAAYIELRGIRSLAAELDRRGIKSKVRTLSDGGSTGGVRMGVGALSNLLRNRTYIGEVEYRSERHVGDHEAIVDRATFELAQELLSANNVAKSVSGRGQPALLQGLLFDDRGSPMTPVHSNKKGIRYRYYVSNALMQKRMDSVGSIARVSAPDVESAVRKALQSVHGSSVEDVSSVRSALIKVIVSKEGIVLHLCNGSAQKPFVVPGPWTDEKAENPSVEVGGDISVVAAIAKSRQWISDLVRGARTVEEIAKAEGKGDRQIRLLLPLAFAGPTLVKAALASKLPPKLTVTELARALPRSWKEQMSGLASASG